MVKRVILHVGTSKTGSTAIQDSLHGYDDGAVLYAPFDSANHSKAMLTLFSEKYWQRRHWTKTGTSREEIDRRREEYRDVLSTTLQRQDRDIVIISGEELCYMMDDPKRHMIETLSSFGCDVTIVCYVRDLTSFAVSQFQQQVKSGLADVPYLVRHSYEHCIEPFRKLVGSKNVVVRRFDRETLIGGDVVVDFCDVAGIAAPVVKASNRSMSADATKLLFHFNKYGPVHSGSHAHAAAHVKFYLAVKKAYRDYPKLDPLYFVPRIDFETQNYLSDHHGISFDVPESPYGRDDVIQYLDDMSSVDLEPLNKILRERRLGTATPENVLEQLSRLYTRFLTNQIKKRSGLFWAFGVSRLHRRFGKDQLEV
ncbi:MAG: hypothetical protein AAGJ34_11455 [Pseudomonadota bacterium]